MRCFSKTRDEIDLLRTSFDYNLLRISGFSPRQAKRMRFWRTSKIISAINSEQQLNINL